MTGETPTRAAVVALVGAPNAGKSTLVNQLVGAKVSIVSAKRSSNSVTAPLSYQGNTDEPACQQSKAHSA